MIGQRHPLILLKAFPPGPAFRVPMEPNVTVVNELGDFDIAADRLAFIDGEGKLLQFRGCCYCLTLIISGSMEARYTTEHLRCCQAAS